MGRSSAPDFEPNCLNGTAFANPFVDAARKDSAHLPRADERPTTEGADNRPEKWTALARASDDLPSLSVAVVCIVHSSGGGRSESCLCWSEVERN